MKLFMWEGKGVLQNWGTGAAFALASDVDEAKALVLKALTDYCRDMGWPDPDSTDEDELQVFRERVAFLENTPAVFDAPTAFLHQGSA